MGINNRREIGFQTPYINFHPKGCVACWKCVEACNFKVIGKVNFLFHRHAKIVKANQCVGCKKCIKVCPERLFTILS